MTDFDEEKHPRDDHGRFGAGSGSLSKWASKNDPAKSKEYTPDRTPVKVPNSDLVGPNDKGGMTDKHTLLVKKAMGQWMGNSVSMVDGLADSAKMKGESGTLAKALLWELRNKAIESPTPLYRGGRTEAGIKSWSADPKTADIWAKKGEEADKHNAEFNAKSKFPVARENLPPPSHVMTLPKGTKGLRFSDYVKDHYNEAHWIVERP